MRITATLLCSILLFALGCYTAPVKPPSGFLYTSFKAPLQTDFHATKIASKSGKASSNYLEVWYLKFGWGGAGVKEAARNGYLERVDYVDYEYVSVLGIFHRFSVIAYGE